MLFYSFSILSLLTFHAPNALAAVLTSKTLFAYFPFAHNTLPGPQNGVVSYIGEANGITTYLLNEPQSPELTATLIEGANVAVVIASANPTFIASYSCNLQQTQAVCKGFNINPQNGQIVSDIKTDSPGSVALLEVGIPQTNPPSNPSPTTPAPAPPPSPSNGNGNSGGGNNGGGNGGGGGGGGGNGVGGGGAGGGAGGAGTGGAGGTGGGGTGGVGTTAGAGAGNSQSPSPTTSGASSQQTNSPGEGSTGSPPDSSAGGSPTGQAGSGNPSGVPGESESQEQGILPGSGSGGISGSRASFSLTLPMSISILLMLLSACLALL